MDSVEPGEDDFLPIRALNDLLFCERRCALHRLEQVWVDMCLPTEKCSAVPIQKCSAPVHGSRHRGEPTRASPHH